MKHFLLLLTLTIGFYMFSSPKTYAQTATAPSFGDGSETTPYHIATLDNLYWLSQNSDEWDKYYLQIADIDAKGTLGWNDYTGFTPIGNDTVLFDGNYCGNGYIIDGLYINRPDDDGLALFSGLGESAVVEGLGLTNVYISGHLNVGGIAASNNGTIIKCYVTGKLQNSYKYLGGIAGLNKTGGMIQNSYSDVELICDDHYAGGISSKNYGKIIQCYSKGMLSGDLAIGGITGANADTIENCYTLMFIDAAGQSGTLVGRQNDGLVINCYSADNIENGKAGIGVFNAGSVDHCYFNSDSVSTSNLATGMTSEEMRNTESFENWDFVNETVNGTENIWKIDENENFGYPFLTWQEEEYISGIEDVSAINISAYPNPVNDKLTIQTEIEGEYSLGVYDLTGKLIYLKKCNSKIANVDLSDYRSGIYIISISTGNERVTKKILKK